MWTEIPQVNHDDAEKVKPGWLAVSDIDGKPLRPIIRCNCGAYIGLANHFVHADGTVTASFFDSNQPFQWKGQTVHNPHGCNWHVHLKLIGYTGGDFPPET
jgi:hypothetical protein